MSYPLRFKKCYNSVYVWVFQCGMWKTARRPVVEAYPSGTILSSRTDMLLVITQTDVLSAWCFDTAVSCLSSFVEKGDDFWLKFWSKSQERSKRRLLRWYISWHAGGANGHMHHGISHRLNSAFYVITSTYCRMRKSWDVIYVFHMYWICVGQWHQSAI